MTALGEMERLCGYCDTPLAVGTYCPRCEEHVPTYEYPLGQRPVYAARQSRIERMVLEQSAEAMRRGLMGG